MSSVVITIADAIVAALIAAPAGTFLMPITPVRRLLPVYDVTKNHELMISVVPKGREIGVRDRSEAQNDWLIDIGVQKKVGKEVPGSDGLEADVDVLLELVEQIGNHLFKKTMADAYWTSTANVPIYSPEHLKDNRLFTGILTLSYQS